VCGSVQGRQGSLDVDSHCSLREHAKLAPSSRAYMNVGKCVYVSAYLHCRQGSSNVNSLAACASMCKLALNSRARMSVCECV
jgi:hypothetical protein